MAAKVTIQDIANELGLSRNTVSKALNNTGVLAETTRQRILAKAIEMGYRQFAYMNPDTVQARMRADTGKNEIALLSGCLLNSSHFSSMLLDRFQLEISKAGYCMSMHIVQSEEIEKRALPASLRTTNLAGLICFELFDPDYAGMLCGTGIPTLFVDSPALSGTSSLKSDLLLMENADAISRFITLSAKRGETRIGFVGEASHCRSFSERYMAFRNAMYLNGLPIHPEWDFHEDVTGGRYGENYTALYREHMDQYVRSLVSLPDIFLCANDFVAIDFIRLLQGHGIDVPGEVKILGFDDAPEATLFTPSLSTVHIHSQIMGSTAAYLLLSRIADPDMNFRTVSCETSLVLRASTGD